MEIFIVCKGCGTVHKNEVYCPNTGCDYSYYGREGKRMAEVFNAKRTFH